MRGLSHGVSKEVYEGVIISNKSFKEDPKAIYSIKEPYNSIIIRHYFW